MRPLPMMKLRSGPPHRKMPKPWLPFTLPMWRTPRSLLNTRFLPWRNSPNASGIPSLVTLIWWPRKAVSHRLCLRLRFQGSCCVRLVRGDLHLCQSKSSKQWCRQPSLSEAGGISDSAHICNVCACITYPNPPSISFHEKHGYETVAHFHASGFKQGEWHDMIWMEKALREHDGAPEPFIPYSHLD